MEALITKNISDLTDEEIRSLNLPEYIKLEKLQGYDNNYMYTPPAKPHLNGVYYPVIVSANMHINHIHDKMTPFKSLQECSDYCEKMNRKDGHTDKSMFMILESIRLEELLRKKLEQEGEIKIKSDYTIRESAGFKYILYDKGVGILTVASINEALNTGLATIKREQGKEQKAEKKAETKCMSMIDRFKGEHHKIW